MDPPNGISHAFFVIELLLIREQYFVFLAIFNRDRANLEKVLGHLGNIINDSDSFWKYSFINSLKVNEFPLKFVMIKN